MTRLIFILIISLTSTICSQAQTIQYIGAPTTTVISRGNFRTDSIFYLPKRSKAPTDTAAFRYQISDSALYVWTGSQWIKAGGSGTISGSGITGYVPQFSGTTTIDTSGLFTLGSRLGIGSSTFAYTSTNTANVELNGTAGGILGFKRNDSARGYLWHTGDNMELANTTAGAISFNTNSATRGSISSAGVWRLHNLAGTGDRVVVASSNGTLSASTSVTGLVDTTTISTRAWRQKGDDSLGAIIATKGSGTVTSVATGYGLSGGTITTTGTLLVDTLNISTRAWRQKGLDSLAALEVSGSGTTNRSAKFTASGTIGNGSIADSASTVAMTILGTNNVGIGTETPQYRLHTFGATGVRAETSSGNISTGIDFASAFVGGRVGGIYMYPGGGAIGNNVFGESANGAIQNIVFSESVFPLKLGTIGAGPLQFYTNSTERLRITSGGNVGIGTATAGGKLTINSSLGDHIQLQRSGQTDRAIVISGSDQLVFGTWASPTQMVLASNGRLLLNTTTDAGYQFDINGTLRSVNGANFATTSGNVGIGTASPAAKLDIAYSTNPTTATPHILLTTGGSSKQAAITAESFSVSGLVFSVGDGTLVDRMTILRSNGNVGIGTTSPSYKLDVTGDIRSTANLRSNNGTVDNVVSFTSEPAGVIGTISNHPETFWTNGSEKMRLSTSGELLINTTTDAGDYKLQVSGNALVTAGKLDITTNTAFGLSVSRSGTSVVGGQINNSNGILYYGAESSTGGGLFTGSSAYAAVIGSGAAYPLQFATDNVTRATINTNGELLINTLTDNGDFKLQVNGNALISGSIKTANGGSSTAQPWHLGSVVATNVQLDTANYVEVEINGVFYRLAIVTPL